MKERNNVTRDNLTSSLSHVCLAANKHFSGLHSALCFYTETLLNVLLTITLSAFGESSSQSNNPFYDNAFTEPCIDET